MSKMEGMGAFKPHEKSENIKAKDEVIDGDHFNKLYDQNEDAAGQRIDEATGKFIENSPSIDGADEELSEVELQEGSEDILGKLDEEDDAAAQWLREQAKKMKGDLKV